MSDPPAVGQSTRSGFVAAGILPALLALPLVAGGLMLAGSALGLELPLVDIVIGAGWARLLFFAAGAFLLFDGGRMLARLVLTGPREPQSPEEKGDARRRIRLLSRARMLAWIGLLGVLTLALPLQAFHVVRGIEVFLAVMVVVMLLLGFLSVTGSLLGSGSLDPSAAQWIVPGRTIEKLAAGAGLRGRATIDSMNETGWRVNDDPQVHFQLTVAVDGREPFRTRVTETVPLLTLGHLARGASLPVLVDADTPEHLLILWKDL